MDHLRHLVTRQLTSEDTLCTTGFLSVGGRDMDVHGQTIGTIVLIRTNFFRKVSKFTIVVSFKLSVYLVVRIKYRKCHLYNPFCDNMSGVVVRVQKNIHETQWLSSIFNKSSYCNLKCIGQFLVGIRLKMKKVEVGKIESLVI